jgi:addiction module HigA family antidote
MLLEEFLKPMGITQRDLANSINVPYQRVNEIINGRRGISPSTALRLAKVFGVSADFWMNLSAAMGSLFYIAGRIGCARPYQTADAASY